MSNLQPRPRKPPIPQTTQKQHHKQHKNPSYNQERPTIEQEQCGSTQKQAKRPTDSTPAGQQPNHQQHHQQSMLQNKKREEHGHQKRTKSHQRKKTKDSKRIHYPQSHTLNQANPSQKSLKLLFHLWVCLACRIRHDRIR